MNKEINKILRELKRRGCTVRPTGGGHWRVSRDGHQSITMAKSPTDHRTLMNVRQDVRRYLGIEL